MSSLDEGSSTHEDEGPLTREDEGPSMHEDEGSSTREDEGPLRHEDEGSSTREDEGPSTREDEGSSTREDASESPSSSGRQPDELEIHWENTDQSVDSLREEDNDQDQSVVSLRDPAANQCDKCGRIYHSVSALKGHIQVEHQGLKHTCQICGSTMKWYGNFLTHMRTMHNVGEPPIKKEKNRKCEHCGTVFPSNKLLYRHLRTVHKESKPIRCRHCSDTFKDTSGLYFHMFDHAEIVSFKCNVCMARFRTKKTLAKHIKAKGHEQLPTTESSADNTDNVCHPCKKNFKTYYSFYVHSNLTCPSRAMVSSVSSTGLTVCVCRTCDKTFKTKGSLKYHEEAVHSDIVHTCSVCGKEFGSLSCLRSHLIIHNDVKNKVCDQCDYRCHTNGDLKKHKRRHTGERHFKCKFCELTFKNASSRKDHENDEHIHVGRAYKCTKCQKSFVRNQTRRQHQRSCNRTFRCQICFKTFTNISSLRRHENKIKCQPKPNKQETCDGQSKEGADCERPDEMQSEPLPDNSSSTSDVFCETSDFFSDIPVSLEDTPGLELSVKDENPTTLQPMTDNDTGNPDIKFEIPKEKTVVLVYKCPICKKKHYSEIDLRTHVKTEHC